MPAGLAGGLVPPAGPLTQASLASLLGVSLGTIRNWEQGRNEPNGTPAILLRLLDRHPELVDEVKHMVAT
ncbi:MAG: helix-turn-helix domain-containing protein [Oceanipulchritudo sp.]